MLPERGHRSIERDFTDPVSLFDIATANPPPPQPLNGVKGNFISFLRNQD